MEQRFCNNSFDLETLREFRVTTGQFFCYNKCSVLSLNKHLAIRELTKIVRNVMKLKIST